jgi:hypothetical protein
MALTLAVTVVECGTVFGRVALAVVGDDASSGHTRLNTVPQAELRYAVCP